jgi:hypothetical protein
VRTYHGTANTVGELIEILSKLPADKPVRTATLSHTWPPEVHEYEEYVRVDVG